MNWTFWSTDNSASDFSSEDAGASGSGILAAAVSSRLIMSSGMLLSLMEASPAGSPGFDLAIL